MSATTYSLTDGQDVSVIGYKGIYVYFNATTAAPVKIQGSLGSDKFTDLKYELQGGAISRSTVASRVFDAGDLIYVHLDGAFDEIQFVGGAVNVDVFAFFDSAGLLPAIAPNDYATLGGLGDSQLSSGIVTTPGNDQQNLTTGRLGAMTGYNCLMWASGYSAGKLVYNGIAGTTGITMQILHDSHLATAMAKRWTFCCVSGGTNDIAGAVASTTTLEYLERIIIGLISVGTIPIIMGVLPNLVTLGAAHDALNIGYRKLAAKYARQGVIFEDAYAPHVETTGLGVAAHFRDNTHLTSAQNKVRGQRLATLILAAHPWVRDAYVPVSDATGKSGLVTNPVYTANAGAVTPTGWSISGVGAVTNVAAGTAVGNEWTLTRGLNSVSATTGNIFPAGATYILVTGITTTNAASANTELGVRDPAFSVAAHAWRWVLDTETPAGFIIAVKFSVPTGFPTNYIRQVNGGANPSSIMLFQTEAQVE